MSPLKTFRSATLLGLACFGLGLAAARPAAAVPVFARKYHTACTTCHAIFPKLNPYGEAFRLNGYRMPGEKDNEDLVKDKPVSLGSEAYKRLWPEAVWPSDLPSHTPIAINIKMADIYASSHDSDGRTLTQNDFQFPQEINLFTAGTLGDNFSFYGELTYSENADGSSDTEIERAHLAVNSPFGAAHLINFKVGKFAADYVDGFHESWIMTDNGIDSLFSYDPIGLHGGTGISEEPRGIALASNVKGIEMYGVADHRWFYTVGVANGIGPASPDAEGNSNRKDYYYRLDYKWGGTAFDGDTTGVTLPPENWREKSLRLGVFGYSGDGSKIVFPFVDDGGNDVTISDRNFDRLGLYASAYYGDLNFFGAYVRGTDKLRITDAASGDAHDIKPDYDSWFVQADYVFKQPFQASLRYEFLRPGDRSVPDAKLLNANFSVLIRANIKAMIEYQRDLNDSLNYKVATVLRFAM